MVLDIMLSQALKQQGPVELPEHNYAESFQQYKAEATAVLDISKNCCFKSSIRKTQIILNGFSGILTKHSKSGIMGSVRLLLTLSVNKDQKVSFSVRSIIR